MLVISKTCASFGKNGKQVDKNFKHGQITCQGLEDVLIESHHVFDYWRCSMEQPLLMVRTDYVSNDEDAPFCKRVSMHWEIRLVGAPFGDIAMGDAL